MNNNELKTYINENLLTAQESALITEQSAPAFNQSVTNGLIVPFYEHGTGQQRVRLFLKSEVEEYALQVADRRKRIRAIEGPPKVKDIHERWHVQDLEGNTIIVMTDFQKLVEYERELRKEGIRFTTTMYNKDGIVLPSNKKLNINKLK